MNTPTNEQVIRIERLLPGSIEHVWEYLTHSQLLSTWLGEGGIVLQSGGPVDLRPRGGGRNAPQIRGEVTRADPPRLLEYTWQAAGDGQDDATIHQAAVVTFELEAQGEHVRLVLTHRRVPMQGLIACAAGWETSLSALANQLEDAQTLLAALRTFELSVASTKPTTKRELVLA